MGRMVMRALANKTCGRIQKSIIPLGLGSIPPNQIVNISLNGLRRWVATFHKNVIVPWINEISIALEFGSQILAMGTPPLLFFFS